MEATLQDLKSKDQLVVIYRRNSMSINYQQK